MIHRLWNSCDTSVIGRYTESPDVSGGRGVVAASIVKVGSLWAVCVMKSAVCTPVITAPSVRQLWLFPPSPAALRFWPLSSSALLPALTRYLISVNTQSILPPCLLSSPPEIPFCSHTLGLQWAATPSPLPPPQPSPHLGLTLRALSGAQGIKCQCCQASCFTAPRWIAVSPSLRLVSSYPSPCQTPNAASCSTYSLRTE